jgi:hypothetical protein
LRQLAIQLYTRRSVDFVPSIRCTLSTGQTFFEPATDCKQFACADATGDPPGCGVRFFSALPQSLPDGAESSPSRAPTLSPPPSSLESFQASSCRLRSSRSPPTAAPARLHAALADLGLVPPRRWALTAIPAAAVCVLSRLPSARSSEAEYGVWLSQPIPPVSRPRLTRGKPGRYGRVAKKNSPMQEESRWDWNGRRHVLSSAPDQSSVPGLAALASVASARLAVSPARRDRLNLWPPQRPLQLDHGSFGDIMRLGLRLLSFVARR